MARTEWHELRLQDLDVEGPDGRKDGPIDVLSCTTTMFCLVVLLDKRRSDKVPNNII